MRRIHNHALNTAVG